MVTASDIKLDFESFIVPDIGEDTLVYAVTKTISTDIWTIPTTYSLTPTTTLAYIQSINVQEGRGVTGFKLPGDAIGYFPDQTNIGINNMMLVLATSDTYKVIEVQKHRRDNGLVWTKANLKFLKTST